MLKVHPNFSINGKKISASDLPEVGYSLVKEGEIFEQRIGEFILDWVDNKQSIKVYTSGSTGKPKAISLLKAHMVNSAIATGNYFNLKPKNTALLCLSADYIAGKMMLVRAMVLGLDIYLVPPASAPLQDLKMDFDFCAMVPLQVANSLSEINRLKILIVGGASISEELKIALKDKSVKAFETYGMTETITHVAVKSIQNNTEYFTTLPKVSISLDERNCLVIDAPSVSKQPVVTNDVVQIISDSQFKWLGRIDNVVNSVGIKLFPEEIESILSKYINHRFFVAGLPSKQYGEEVSLIVEGDCTQKQVENILQQVKGLSKFQMPKSIQILPKFCLTENGKIQRLQTIALLS